MRDLLLISLLLGSCTSPSIPSVEPAPLIPTVPVAMVGEEFVFDENVETAITVDGLRIELVWHGTPHRMGPLSEAGFRYSFQGLPDEHSSGLGHFYIHGRNVWIEREWDSWDEEPILKMRMEKSAPRQEMVSPAEAHALAVAEAKSQGLAFIRHRRVRHPLEHSKIIVIFDVDQQWTQIVGEVDRVTHNVEFWRGELFSPRYAKADSLWDGYFEKYIDPEIRVTTDSKEAREALAVAGVSLKFCINPRLHHTMRLSTSIKPDGQLKAVLTDERTAEERRDPYANHNWFMAMTGGCLKDIAVKLAIHPLELEITLNPIETMVEEVNEGSVPTKLYKPHGVYVE